MSKAPEIMMTGGDDNGPFNIYLHKNGCLTWSFAPDSPPHGYEVGDGEVRYVRADLYEQLQAENAALNSLIDDLIEARDEGLKTKKPLQSESNNGIL